MPRAANRPTPEAPAGPPPSSRPTGPAGSAAPVNHPAHEKALVGLWLAIDACREFLDGYAARPSADPHECGGDGGAPCGECTPHELASDMRGMLFTLELYAGRLEDQAAPFPEQVERLCREWRDRGTPQAEAILHLLEAVREDWQDKRGGPQPQHVPLRGEGSR